MPGPVPRIKVAFCRYFHNPPTSNLVPDVPPTAPQRNQNTSATQSHLRLLRATGGQGQPHGDHAGRLWHSPVWGYCKVVHVCGPVCLSKMAPRSMPPPPPQKRRGPPCVDLRHDHPIGPGDLLVPHLVAAPAVPDEQHLAGAFYSSWAERDHDSRQPAGLMPFRLVGYPGPASQCDRP
jgi:hypothetical protein